MQQPTQTPPEAQIERSKLGPVSALLITFLAFFGSQVLAGLLIAYPYSFFTHQQLDESLFTKINNLIAGQLIYIVLVELLILAIVYWFMQRGKIRLSEIGLGRLPKLSDAGYAVLYAIAYFVVLIVVMGIIQSYLPVIDVEQEQQIGFEGASGPLQLGLVFFALAILVPFTEEVLVRGFLYSGMRRKLTRIAAALIVSLLFGIAHLQLGTGEPPLYVVAIDTFILSLFLIALREKTGSLWSGIMVHALKNGLAFVSIFVFHVS